MIRSLVFLLAIAGFSAAQYRPQQAIDYAQAAILSDTRYLSGDGTFGAAYTQEDGVEFKEESDVDGNRRGSYSYVDPSGQRRTVTYTAGKNGFQASGDHLPVPPAPIAPPQPQPQYQPQYTPQYQPQPQPQYRAQPLPQFPPQTRPSFVPASPEQYDDGQYRESYNNQQSQITQAIQGANPTGQYSYSYAPTPSPVSYSPVSPYNARFAQPAGVAPTPVPHRFFPPGKLDLNRTPDGFSYTFTKS